MSKIVPAILALSVADLEQKLAKIPSEIDLVHIDVLEIDIWTDTKINFEVHLMVKEPAKIIDKWVDRGAKRIIAHKFIQIKGIEFGLALKLSDPIENLDKADFAHLMSIDEIGEQGHPFNPKVFDRIREVREKFPQIPISVDGGVSIENYQRLIDLGVDRLIVGSGFKELWNSLTKK